MVATFDYILYRHCFDMSPPFTGHPVKGGFLCVTVTNSNERQSNYEAALLKAKKQRLSKNSEKKDIN